MVQLWKSTVIYKVLWALACSLTPAPQDLRHVELVKAHFRRRYAGRRMAWLRAESHIHYAGLVVVWRAAPWFIRALCLALVAYMAYVASHLVGPWALAPLSTTRNRGHAELAALLDSIDAAPVLERVAEYNRRGGPKGYPLRSLWRAHVASFALGLAQHQ